MEIVYGNDIFYHYTDFQALDGILQYAEQEGIPADRVMALLQKKC